MGFTIPFGRSLWSAATAAALALVLFAAVSSARTVGSSDNAVRSSCRLNSGRTGECRLITECPSALAALRRTARQGQPNTRHPRCGFKGNVEIVCCERDTGAGGPGNRHHGGVRHNQGSRDPGMGMRRPYLTGGGSNRGRLNQDAAWLPGSNRGGRPAERPVAAQTESVAAAACRVYAKQCPNNVRPYIIDGTVAGLGEIPHMAALGYQSTDENGEPGIKWDCGGTLISDRVVMTAAHCTKSTSGLPVVVRLGDQDLARDDEGASPVDFQIEKIDDHPEYNSNTRYHDISLLRLSRSVNFTEFICPACLYTGGGSSVGRRGGLDLSNRIAEDGEEVAHGNASGSSSDIELTNRLLWDGEEVGPRQSDAEDLGDKDLYVSGWGATSFPAGDRSPVLMLAKISPYASNECNTTLHQSHGRTIPLIPRGLFPDGQVCAGDRTGKKDTCMGDSGGPLQFNSKESSSLITVVGITSFGLKCGFSLPGVYTRVSNYVNWIERVAWPQGPPS